MQHALESAREGAEASVRVSCAVRALLRSDAAADRVMRCLELNGLVFGGSLALGGVALPALVQRLGDALLVSEAEGQATVDAARAYADAALVVTWFAPMAVLSYVQSAVWWSEIATEVRLNAGGREAGGADGAGAADAAGGGDGPPPSRYSFVANEMYRVLLVCVLTLQSYLAMQLPWALVGIPLAYALTAWMCAFYCFDYRWVLDGWSLERRIAEFERRWAYMLGFGTPLALVGLTLPLLTSCVVYALVFPVCMVVAVVGRAPPAESRRVRVFWTASWLLRHALRVAVGGAAPQQAAPASGAGAAAPGSGGKRRKS